MSGVGWPPPFDPYGPSGSSEWSSEHDLSPQEQHDVTMAARELRERDEDSVENISRRTNIAPNRVLTFLNSQVSGRFMAGPDAPDFVPRSQPQENSQMFNSPVIPLESGPVVPPPLFGNRPPSFVPRSQPQGNSQMFSRPVIPLESGPVVPPPLFGNRPPSFVPRSQLPQGNPQMFSRSVIPLESGPVVPPPLFGNRPPSFVPRSQLPQGNSQMSAGQMSGAFLPGSYSAWQQGSAQPPATNQRAGSGWGGPDTPSEGSAPFIPPQPTNVSRRRTYSDAPKPSFGSSGAPRPSSSSAGHRRSGSTSAAKSYHSSLPSIEKKNIIERGAMQGMVDLGDEFGEGPSNPTQNYRGMRRKALDSQRQEQERAQNAATSTRQAVLLQDAGQSANSPLKNAYKSVKGKLQAEGASNPRLRAFASVAANAISINRRANQIRTTASQPNIVPSQEGVIPPMRQLQQGYPSSGIGAVPPQQQQFPSANPGPSSGPQASGESSRARTKSTQKGTPSARAKRK